MTSQIDAKYNGTLPACMERAGIDWRISPESRAFKVAWYRAQMREWARWWRMGWLKGVSLSLAKHYRDRSADIQVGGAA